MRTPLDQFKEKIATLGASETARRLGVSAAAANHWKNGVREPGHDARVSMHTVLGIPSDAPWCSDGNGGSDTPQEKTPAPAAVRAIRRRRVIDLGGKAHLEAVLEEAVGLQDEADDWSPRDRIGLLGVRADTSKALARLNGENSPSEAAFAASPPFKRFVAGLVEVLKPHPDALRAVLAYCESLEPN